MPDAAIETALAHWAPRRIQNGVDYNDLMATIARTGTWADWLPEWNRTADAQAAFAAEADAVCEQIRANPPADGVAQVLAPGEAEERSRERRLAEGVPVADRTWEELSALASRLGVSA